jgi:NAD(P)-dependent dehydrogenase (short-subunit alcohol dehydrogenase family)
MTATLRLRFDLTNRIAMVIGGGGILGSAIARGLGASGARIAITSRSVEKIKPIAEEMRKDGLEATGLAMDALSRDSIEGGLEKVESTWGPVDILVNAAGGNQPGATVSQDNSFFDLPEADLRGVVHLNLFAGAILPCQVIGEKMAASDTPSSIINISSMAAIQPVTRVIGYSAAKAAVTNFNQWFAVYMAKELGCRVRVNAIAPGFFLTEQNRFLLTTDGETPSPRGETIISQTPMGRFGEPEELVGAAVWLASEESSFVTGITVPVDGGFSAFSGV